MKKFYKNPMYLAIAITVTFISIFLIYKGISSYSKGKGSKDIASVVDPKEDKAEAEQDKVEAEAGAKVLKVLNLHISSKLGNIDPVSVGTVNAAKVVFNIYEPLYTYSHTKSRNVIIPLLAESLPEISKDKLTYTIKLKQGVYFQNNACFKGGKGREVNAQDVVNSIKRVGIPNLKCPVYGYFKSIKGIEEFRKQIEKEGCKVDYTKDIEGLKVIDEYTLRITLETPYALLLDALTLGNIGVVPQEAIDYYKEEFRNNPVGTGHYCLEKYDPMSSKIVLEKNPTCRDDYFPPKDEIDPEFRKMLPSAGKKLPLVDKIVFHIIPQENSVNLKLMNGELDINDSLSSDEIYTVTGALPEYPNFLERRNKLIEGQEVVFSGKNMQAHLVEGYDLSLIYLNTHHPNLKNNKKLRLAMSVGFNKKRVIEKILNGNGKLVHPINIPGYEDYDPDYKNSNFCYDVEKAKKLLEEANYPEGEGLDEIVMLISSDNTTRKKIAEFFKDDMERIGIPIKIVQMDFPKLLEKVKKESDNTWGGVMLGWLPDLSTSLDFEKLFYGKNKGGCNNSWYDNPEYNKLYEKVIIMDDTPERAKVRKQMKDIIARDTPVLSICSKESIVLCQPCLRNYRNIIFSYGVLKYFDKVEGEQDKVEGEQDKVEGEQDKVEGEQGKAEGEQGKVEAEQGKVEAEQGKVEGEQDKVEGEQGKVEGEQDKVEGEQGKAEAEQGKVEAEQGKVEAEQGKVEAEQDKVEAKQDKVK